MTFRTLVLSAALLAVAPAAYADERSDAKAQVEFGIKMAQNAMWKEATYRWEKATEIDPTYAGIDGEKMPRFDGEGHVLREVVGPRSPVELKTEVECLRALVFQACEEYVAGKDVTLYASMAKLKAGRLAREVTDTCLQFWGGQGYMWETHIARAYRDSRLLSIGGGADEIMLGIICKLLGTLPGKRKKEEQKTAAAA